MAYNLLRIHYSRIKFLNIPSPFRHTYLEFVDSKNKKSLKRGFTISNPSLSLISVILPVPGKIEKEWVDSESSIVISRDKNKIKKTLSNSENLKWKTYHTLLHDCFQWRNKVLKSSGIHPPKMDWL